MIETLSTNSAHGGVQGVYRHLSTATATGTEMTFSVYAPPHASGARAYYDGVLSATTVDQSGDAAYLSLGLDHHNLSLRAAERAGLAAIGLQVAPGLDLGELERRIGAMGLATQRKSDARPGVPRLLEVTDVGGHTIQLLPEMAAAVPGFSGRGIDPVRLGHVAVLSTDAAQLVRFLTDALGFSTTDWFEDFVTFVTCNRDHHVLNIIQAPFATMHHLAFQLNGPDHQVRAADHLTRPDTPTLWGPARHTACHNIASYHHVQTARLSSFITTWTCSYPSLGFANRGRGMATCRNGPSTGRSPR